ncbi:RidA family protein [Ihubacter sp. rT4E-8]|uniref:RidA family protein n=1 Tax=Ihubacter sp. rT4E-8 TaxID=3242369 RepID=UPI003CEA5D21
MKEIIVTEKAPAAIGPYAQAVKTDSLIFISGQLGIDPATGNLAGNMEAQCEQALANLQTVLDAAGSSLKNVVKTTCFLQNMDDFAIFNQVYESYFTEAFPARSAFEVAKLPKSGLVEIEAIAVY